MLIDFLKIGLTLFSIGGLLAGLSIAIDNVQLVRWAAILILIGGAVFIGTAIIMIWTRPDNTEKEIFLYGMSLLRVRRY